MLCSSAINIFEKRH